ncbi:MAG TPA: HEAT repeat domain-containing protein [Anaerolineae bacterium]|nr:HEAT repeat domain-containing protein [Anaerolineae bacterium]
MEAKRDVKGLAKALGYQKDPSVRLAAVQALVRIGAPAVEPLMAALGDRIREVRHAAAQALGEIGDGRAVWRLSTALQDGENDVRQAAAHALVRIGAPAVNPLIATLPDEAAAEALSRIGAAAVEPLIVALKRPSAAAAQILGRIGDIRAVEPLVGALGYSDERVHHAAAQALGQIGNPALERLVALLDTYRRETSRHMSDWAENALVQIGAPAVEPLIAVLKHGSSSAQRDNAARALGRIRDARAVEPLIAALRGDSAGAAWALGEIGDARAVEPLVALLAAGDWRLRCVTVSALGRLGGAAVEPLIAAVQRDDNLSVRQAAAQALLALYQAGTLDKLHWRLILENRSMIITQSHTDRDIVRGGSDCHSEKAGHEDSVIPFPV